jgi:hypothetical protein
MINIQPSILKIVIELWAFLNLQHVIKNPSLFFGRGIGTSLDTQ